MQEAFIIDGVRTPIGRYAGSLASVRPDDLAAHVLRTLLDRHPSIDPAVLDEVILGCGNQSGEDNRNVARMALLVAGLPVDVPGMTVNRLCGSGLEAVATAARMIRAGEANLVLAGGTESMSRAPFVLGKAEHAYSRNVETFDTTIGWRFVNPIIEREHGVDPLGITAENVADEFGISRDDQDALALRSQERARAKIASGRMAREIVPIKVVDRHGQTRLVDTDEHPRETSLEALGRLKPAFRPDGSVTAGNSSGINDGAAALLVASARAVEELGLTPIARIAGATSAGVPPRVMGIGPVPATRSLLTRHGLGIGDIGVIELNEAFASQVLAVLRELGVPDDAEHVNAGGGAIALGHPIGMSGARLALVAALEMSHRGEQIALATMCIGVGQGIALLLQAA